jgi:hypothetical protein
MLTKAPGSTGPAAWHAGPVLVAGESTTASERHRRDSAIPA